MAQQRFWNFKEDDLTGLLIRWMTGLHPSGRYFGYDFVSSANMTLGLAHSTTGFKYVEAPTTAESAFLGMVVTRQGTIIIEDTALSIGTVTNGDATNPRIDTVILTHERSEIVGGTQALYSIITGVPGATPTAPTVTDALRQTIVGTLYVPANTTLLNDVGVVWTPSQKPNFANANPLDYINLTANRATETNADGDLVASLVTNTELNVLDGMTASTAELNKLDGATPTTTEINYVDGVTSPIQTQINDKEPTITGGATSIVTTDLTINRVLVSDASGKVTVHPTVSDTELSVLDGLTATTAELNILDGATPTTTELNYVDGVTSPIQTQLNSMVEVDSGGVDTVLKVKIIDIGDWDMDVTTQITVTHGIPDYKKIKRISVMIRDDTDSLYTPIDTFAASTAPQGSFVSVASTTVTLKRLLAGYYDSIIFATTPYNRGWITIEYAAS